MGMPLQPGRCGVPRRVGPVSGRRARARRHKYHPREHKPRHACSYRCPTRIRVRSRSGWAFTPGVRSPVRRKHSVLAVDAGVQLRPRRAEQILAKAAVDVSLSQRARAQTHCRYEKASDSGRARKRGGARVWGDPYSITSSAMASTPGGMARASAFAVLRLITSSNLVGRTTGRSPAFSPLRMRPT